MDNPFCHMLNPGESANHNPDSSLLKSWRLTLRIELDSAAESSAAPPPLSKAAKAAGEN